MSVKVKKDVIINIRIDSDLKEQSKNVLTVHKMDHSKAVRMLMNYIAKNGTVPEFMQDSVSK